MDAVVAGDAPHAQVRLLEHLDELTQWLYTQSARRHSGSATAVFAASSQPGQRVKPAELVAARIYQDITDNSREVGSILGSEVGLAARYKTSRSVLRAAVRLLEHHSVARARRGPGGGLVVTRPEPRASIDTAALYLAFHRATDADLRIVHSAIALGVVALVVAGRDDPDIAIGLHSLADQKFEDVPSDGAAMEARFLLQLAVLAGNPVLSLFLQILTDLVSRTWFTVGHNPVGRDGISEIAGTHGMILTAIRDGDLGLAQHRMRRHLDASWSYSVKRLA